MVPVWKKNKNYDFEDTDCHLAITTAAMMTLDLLALPVVSI